MCLVQYIFIAFSMLVYHKCQGPTIKKGPSMVHDKNIGPTNVKNEVKIRKRGPTSLETK